MQSNVFLLLMCLLPAWLSAQTGPGIVKSEFIYETAPFPSCHASTIAETPTGLVTSWFGGTHEKHPDVGIWVSRQEKGVWTPPVEVANGVQADGKRHPCWNPVLFQFPKGPLVLYYKVGPSPSTWWGMEIRSTDGGKTWSAPKRLPDGILGPIKNKPELLASGKLLSPTSTEHDGWRLHVESSTDKGKTWQATPPLNSGKPGAIQPSILIHPGGKLQMVCRGTGGYILSTWSTDGGTTWSPLENTPLPNPNSGIDAVTLKDGRHVLIYNHISDGAEKWGRRSVLNAAFSKDGKVWEAANVLENEPKAEFSYPAVIQTKDGLVHITYTWKRERIKHVVLDPSKVMLTAMKDGKWPE
ncbi:sialidase family protein [Arsenicibacter rosenii]|uniref:Sialidase n=1 Tax=Arsenicibacter rosenii TaxID=1750698 RepID=A0A1S2VNG4_9BACT|nr:sialidase family protein [Arsenicibacter rosenii]OIN60322.1 sialidase [Arsenicibacter rosenii]